MKRPVLLLDCNYLCYQAFFAFKSKLSHEENPTQVIYGFLIRVLTLSSTFNTHRLVFCWDSKLSKRKKVFPDYKINRRKNKQSHEDKSEFESLFSQMEILKYDVLPRLGFRNVHECLGYEADDILGWLSQNIKAKFIYIVSSDEDLFQLLRDQSVIMYNPSTKRYTTEEDLFARHSVIAEDWKEVKALAGCHTDKIPGLKGVGIKTACGIVTGKIKRELSKKDERCIERNRLLQDLPFPGLPTDNLLPMKKNSITMKKVKEVCEDYGLISLLRGGYRNEWLYLISMVRGMA